MRASKIFRVGLAIFASLCLAGPIELVSRDVLDLLKIRASTTVNPAAVTGTTCGKTAYVFALYQSYMLTPCNVTSRDHI